MRLGRKCSQEVRLSHVLTWESFFCALYIQDCLLYTSILPNDLKKYKAIERFSPAALYRFYIPEMFLDLEKVIYLDGDTITLLDIEKLWKINIKDFAIAAVQDRIVKEKGINGFSKNKFFERIQILNNNYFNSGVLIFNLEKIRKNYNMKKECFLFLEKNPDAPALDQDSLNFIFQKDCMFLNEIFNMPPDKFVDFSFLDVTNMECILHFHTWYKPWMTNRYPISRCV